MITKLYSHQEMGAKYLRDRKGGYLFWKMRTGKTLAALHGILDTPTLILTKGSIMETFRKALVYDMGIRETDIVVCHGKFTWKKRKQLLTKFPIVICNYEAAITLRVMTAQPWAAIVFDESYALANYKSAKVTRYIERSIKKQPREQKRAALSGTPASENPIQYASQFFIVDGYFMGYTNIHDYYHDNWMLDKNKKQVPINKKHLKELHEYIHQEATFLSLEELNLGSPILYNKRFVQLNMAQLGCIEWAQGRKAELNRLFHGMSDRSVGNMVYAVYENMIAAGIDPATHEVISTEKVQDVVNCYLDNREPILVLSHYVDILPVAEELFHKAGIRAAYFDGKTSKIAVEEVRALFQEGKLDAVIAQSKVAGEGLDFSRANTTYYLNNSFGLNTREQTIMRTTNINKTTPVEIIDICTMDTLDVAVVEKLQKKEKISESFLMKQGRIK
ncbi:MAG: helicase-related protein [bacterium]